MPYKRNVVNGTSPLDMKSMNDNFSALWLKVFGDINMSDIQDDIKKMLYTNWLQPQGEGNIDSTHPLYVRFYVPPNTKKVKQAKINIILSRYRVDSDVAISIESKTYSSSVTSSASNKTTAGQSTIETSGQMNTTSSGSSSSSTSADGGGVTNVGSDINFWQNVNWTYPFTNIEKHVNGTAIDPTKNLCRDITTTDSLDSTFVDFYNLQHYHKINLDPHSHNMEHYHDISHNHNISHTHNIDHTHQIDVEITIPAHGHNLNMAIKEADTAPSNVKIFVNETDIGINLSGDNESKNDIDITDKIIIGEWNTIKLTSDNISRATIYGIAELLQKYN